MKRLSTATAPCFDGLTSRLFLDEEPTETRFVFSVARVLGLAPDQIDLCDSFAELGGDSEQAAAALRNECMGRGLAVSTHQILRCRSLADVLRSATACEPQPSTAGEDGQANNRRSLVVEVEVDNMLSPMSNRDSASGLFDQAVTSHDGVDGAALIRPKAGLLEGKLVALLALSTDVPMAPKAAEMRLVSKSQALLAGAQVSALRRTVASIIPAESLPDVWIVLESMPRNGAGEIDQRRLRTWVQNMNQGVYQQALDLEGRRMTETERSVQSLGGRARQDRVGADLSFSLLGGDEPSATDLVAHESMGVSSVAEMQPQRASGLGAAGDGDDGPERCGLAPMQRLYLETAMSKDAVLRTDQTGAYRFNQSVRLMVNKPVSLENVSAALEAIVQHHPMLRARFSRRRGGWWQRIVVAGPDSYALHHHSVATDSDMETIVAQTQAAINIEVGPVFAADYMTTNGQDMLCLVAHHLVVDLPSWRIIVHDLDELLANGILWSQSSLAFPTWIEQHTAAFPVLPSATQQDDHRYWGLDKAPNTYGDSSEAGFTLDAEQTALLQTSCHHVLRTDCVDIFLTALLLSFAQTFHDRPVPTVWNQENGRDGWGPDSDTSETVGWFTTLCPLRQAVKGSDDFMHVLRRLKDMRRKMAARGSPCVAHGPLEVVFGYTGSLPQLSREDGVLQQVSLPGKRRGSWTADIGPRVGRMAVFEISAMVDQGTTKVEFVYSRHAQHGPRILGWVKQCKHMLVQGIGLLRHGLPELTLADVPHLDVSYKGLATFQQVRLAKLHLGVQDVEAVYPVTAVEQSILIGQAQRPETGYVHAIYELACASGDAMDVSRICTAWQLVTARHAALRAVFLESVSRTGLYDKVILRRASPAMLFIETGRGEDCVDELGRVPSLETTDAQPNHRMTVCKAPTATLVRLDVCTALCDARSTLVLMDDLRRAYVTQRLPGDCFAWASYLDFVRRSRRPESVAYWCDRLQDVPPCYFPRLTAQVGRRRVLSECVQLNVRMHDLPAQVRALKTSVDAVLRLAWGIVLRVYSGSDQVCFGYQTTGRDGAVAGIEHAVGAFSNTIACAYLLGADDRLGLALAGVEQQVAESLPHQHLADVEAQHARRLFNSCLAYTDRCSTDTLGLYQTLDIDVAVHARPHGSKMVLDVNQRIMTSAQAAMVAGTFGRVVRAILASPDQRIRHVDLISERDYAQLNKWGTMSSRSEPPVRCLVQDLIARHVSGQPHGPAVCGSDGCLTYQELDGQAAGLAHYLVEAGVGPHVVVPVVMGKTRLVPVALLAVLKAGGAFVPIDADDLDLLQPIFERINCAMAIASEAPAAVLGNMFDKVIVLDDAFMARLPQLASRNGSPSSIVGADDAACVLFELNGSRDVRGFSFNHAALATTFVGQGRAAHLSSSSRVMQLSSLGRGFALAELFTTLVHGGCVCVPGADERLQHDFDDAVRRMQVNWTYLTPVLARKLDPAMMPTLRTVCFSTLHLDEDTLAAWLGKAEVLLAYGAVDVCPLGICFHAAAGPHDLRKIGRPFAGSTWVVNIGDAQKLAPVGALGELLIEGPTLARPYPWTEPSQTKTRFVKTGHHVRYVEGGLMEFVASKREAWQSRLAEIERRVRQCLGRGVDVVVDILACRGPASVPSLVAFVELGLDWPHRLHDLTRLCPETKERVAMLKQRVQTELRRLMAPELVPSIFVPVKQLPITPALKADRRRLLASIAGRSLCLEQLAPSSAESPDAKPPPLTHNEARMRALWAQVLGINQAAIGAADGFLHVGGNEVLATKLLVACRHAGLPISIADVLRNAPLSELSVSMAGHQCDGGSVAEPVKSARCWPPTAGFSDSFIANNIAPKLGVGRELVVDVAEATSTQIRHLEAGLRRDRSGIDYFLFRLAGAIHAKRLEEACKALVAMHPILRTGFVPYSRSVYQAVLASSYPIDFKKDSLPSWRLASSEEKWIRKDRTVPVTFVIPVTRFALLEAGKQSTLILRLSRAQYDDLSMALLIKDLQTLYDGVEQPPQRAPFCDFVRSANMANAHGAEDYWRELLHGAAMTAVVAHTQPYPLSSTVESLSKAATVACLAHLGLSFETVLKSAWAMVLATLSASSDIVFGELIDGRHVRLCGGHPMSSLMGPTSNVLAVRVKFHDCTMTPLALLRAVHAQRIAGIRHENLGFLSVVEKCTQWPYWTRFSTLVQHCHEHAALGLPVPESFCLGSATCRLFMIEAKAQDVPDLFVQSILRGVDSVDLTVSFCRDRIATWFAQDALAMLAAAVTSLTSVGTMQPLIPAGYRYRNMANKLPFRPNPATATPTVSLLSPHSLPLEHSRAINKVIANAWTNILNPRMLGVPKDQTCKACFYDLWGSVIPAAQLAAYLNRVLPKLGIPHLESNFNITMEEVIENPNMAKQYELVLSKIRAAAQQKEASCRGPKEKRSLDPLSVHSLSPLQEAARPCKGSMAVSVAGARIGKTLSRFTKKDKETDRDKTRAPTLTPPLRGTASGLGIISIDPVDRLAPVSSPALCLVDVLPWSSPMALTPFNEPMELEGQASSPPPPSRSTAVVTYFDTIEEEPEPKQDGEEQPRGGGGRRKCQ